MVIAKVLLVVVAMMLDVAAITLEFEILLGTAMLVFVANIQAGSLMMLNVVAIPLDFKKMWFEMLLGTAMLAFVANIQAGSLMMLNVVAIPLDFEKMWFEMLLGTATLAFVANIQAGSLMMLNVVAIPLEIEKIWCEMLLEVCTNGHAEGFMTQRNNDNNPSGGLSKYDKVEKNTLSLSELNSILINFDDSKNTNTSMTYKPIAHEGEKGNRICGNDKQQGDLQRYDISPSINVSKQRRL